MNEKVQELKYKAATLAHSVDLIHCFLNPYKNEWDWSNIIYNQYPELREKIAGIKKVSDRKTVELAFFKELIESNKIDLAAKAKIFQSSWNKVGVSVFAALANIVETDWQGITEVVASVSLNPINPRFIESSTFDIFYGSSPELANGTAVHEIFHFIYFKKWREIFPKTKKREFDAPYLVWHLSEMVPGIVLNDIRLQKVFKHKFHSYDVYESAFLDEKPLLSYLQNFYNNRKDFADFLQESWEFVQKNKKFIQSL